ncbi:carboxypeptidase-like regulatory domain-containing protein [uncultured Pontibacter sp.]|uniref:carboxypeptidase-like regulatory domain-containing protein n=1 Tax=uncultured Pontibacter sp. TaxID=453356 RepID=UPI002621AF6E|nr:carboxypeptidase-like regulatory domain-containing protein [uncultured Pontibacter sp.]
MHYKHFWLFAIAFLLNTSHTFAQAIKIAGKVLDATTQQPVPYANIGVAGKELGTVANASGEFSFTANTKDLPLNGSIVVSCVGYESTELQINMYAAKPYLVKLKQKSIPIAEVSIKPRKLKKKVLGKNDREYLTSTAFFNLYDKVDDKLGRELGNIIKLNDKACYANDFNIYINHNPFAMVKLRLNFYTVVDNIPGESILKEDIIFELADKQRGWVTVDLQKYNIVLEGMEEVAVTLQWLESKQQNPKDYFLSISGAISPAKRYVRREKSEAEWTRTNAYLSLYLNADCYKPENYTEITAQ